MSKIIRIFKKIRYNEISIWNTIYFNFKVLPFRSAIKLPFILGRYVQFEKIENLDVQFTKRIHFAMVYIGLKYWPVSATKGNYSFLHAEKGAVLRVGDNVVLAPGFAMNIYNNASLELGSNIFINHNTKVCAKNVVHVCDGAHIGWNCQIYDNSFHFTYNKDSNKIKNMIGRVYIGEKTWIANGCTISGNVYIPRESIVAALSLVNKDFSEISSTGNFFAGCPASLKKTGLYRIFSHRVQLEIMDYFASHPENINFENDIYSLEDMQKVDKYT